MVNHTAGRPHRRTQQPPSHFRVFGLGCFLVVVAAAGCDGLVVSINRRLVATTTSCGTRNLALSPQCRARLGSVERFQGAPQHLRRIHERQGLHGLLRQSSALSGAPAVGGAIGPIAALTTSSSASSSVYMVLLALQFGLQPILTQRYAGRDSSILKTTYVGVQDVTRFTICGIGLLLPMWSTVGSFRGLIAAVTVAFASYHPSWEVLVPAVLYSLQNYCSITAYQSLDAITYNVLNQTKTLFAALWCFALLQQRQSILQMVALVMLVGAAFIMESNQQAPQGMQQQLQQQRDTASSPSSVSDPGSTAANDKRGKDAASIHSSSQSRHRRVGVMAVLAASMTSGLAGAWTQRCLHGRSNNSLVFSMELSVISFSLLVGTALVKRWLRPQSFTAAVEPADDCTSSTRLFRGWTTKTWIPVITNSLGGILVGLVTKHAGVVPKGFALILGLFLSGVLQNFLQRTHVSNRQWLGGTLAGLSLYLHAAFPPPLQ